MTAGEVLARIKAALGVPWRDQTYRDTFKFGGPDTPVTGIATTAFTTLAVIEQAAAAGLNMIVPHEVTWWSDRDDQSIVAADPIYARKVDLLRRHGMVVFRMHDHAHARTPDVTFVGSARTIGLDPATETAPGSHLFELPETTLGDLAARIARTSGARALRVVGDRSARVRRVRLGVGYGASALPAGVDVVVTGEMQEADGAFDSPAYVLDAATAGIPKGWIVLGHVVSEEPGMQELAEWLGHLVPELPVRLIESGEPFWVP